MSISYRDYMKYRIDSTSVDSMDLSTTRDLLAGKNVLVGPEGCGKSSKIIKHIINNHPIIDHPIIFSSHTIENNIEKYNYASKIRLDLKKRIDEDIETEKKYNNDPITKLRVKQFGSDDDDILEQLFEKFNMGDCVDDDAPITSTLIGYEVNDEPAEKPVVIEETKVKKTEDAEIGGLNLNKRFPYSSITVPNIYLIKSDSELFRDMIGYQDKKLEKFFKKCLGYAKTGAFLYEMFSWNESEKTLTNVSKNKSFLKRMNYIISTGSNEQHYNAACMSTIFNTVSDVKGRKSYYLFYKIAESLDVEEVRKEAISKDLAQKLVRKYYGDVEKINEQLSEVGFKCVVITKQSLSKWRHNKMVRDKEIDEIVKNDRTAVVFAQNKVTELYLIEKFRKHHGNNFSIINDEITQDSFKIFGDDEIDELSKIIKKVKSRGTEVMSPNDEFVTSDLNVKTDVENLENPGYSWVGIDNVHIRTDYRGRVHTMVGEPVLSSRLNGENVLMITTEVLPTFMLKEFFDFNVFELDKDKIFDTAANLFVFPTQKGSPICTLKENADEVSEFFKKSKELYDFKSSAYTFGTSYYNPDYTMESCKGLNLSIFSETAIIAKNPDPHEKYKKYINMIMYMAQLDKARGTNKVDHILANEYFVSKIVKFNSTVDTLNQTLGRFLGYRQGTVKNFKNIKLLYFGSDNVMSEAIRRIRYRSTHGDIFDLCEETRIAHEEETARFKMFEKIFDTYYDKLHITGKEDDVTPEEKSKCKLVLSNILRNTGTELTLAGINKKIKSIVDAIHFESSVVKEAMIYEDIVIQKSSKTTDNGLIRSFMKNLISDRRKAVNRIDTFYSLFCKFYDNPRLSGCKLDLLNFMEEDREIYPSAVMYFRTEFWMNVTSPIMQITYNEVGSNPEIDFCRNYVGHRLFMFNQRCPTFIMDAKMVDIENEKLKILRNHLIANKNLFLHNMHRKSVISEILKTEASFVNTKMGRSRKDCFIFDIYAFVATRILGLNKYNPNSSISREIKSLKPSIVKPNFKIEIDRKLLPDHSKTAKTYVYCVDGLECPDYPGDIIFRDMSPKALFDSLDRVDLKESYKASLASMVRKCVNYVMSMYSVESHALCAYDPNFSEVDDAIDVPAFAGVLRNLNKGRMSWLRLPMFPSTFNFKNKSKILNQNIIEQFNKIQF